MKHWKQANARIDPGTGTVDIWRIRTQLAPDQLALYEDVLSAAQRNRAARLKVREKRCQYIIAHGLTRRILGRALRVAPAAVEFCRGPKGKPYLGGAFAGRAIQFNMTHTSHLALVAVTRDREVGIDIEHIRDDLAWEKLARRYFSPLEVEAFEAQPEASRLRTFFVCWTRKEAVLKAIGTGLGGGLASFDVSVDPDAPPKLLANRWNGRFHGDWSMHQLEPGDGYVATLVTERGGAVTRCWDVDPGNPP